jgi:hypothetical protein
VSTLGLRARAPCLRKFRGVVMAIEVIKPRALPLLLLSFFNTRPTPTHTLFPKLNRLYNANLRYVWLRKHILRLRRVVHVRGGILHLRKMYVVDSWEKGSEGRKN